jgi:hypothetical protein
MLLQSLVLDFEFQQRIQPAKSAAVTLALAIESPPMTTRRLVVLTWPYFDSGMP